MLFFWHVCNHSNGTKLHHWKKNTKQNVSSIWINKDGETRTKMQSFVIMCFISLLYMSMTPHKQTEMKIFSLQNFYTIGVLLEWHTDAKEVYLNSYCIKIHYSNIEISKGHPIACFEAKSWTRGTALQELHTQGIGGWVCPKTSLDKCRKSCSHWNLFPRLFNL